jgi:oxygen-dependent protoporphyrinogen oxidase
VSDVPRSLAGYGYLVTRSEAIQTLGVVWESSLFDDRAPAGTALLRAFVGGARHPDSVHQSESEVEAVARRELQGVLGVSADPIRSWVFRWPQAIAQYTRGHIERVRRSRELVARHAGLHLVGTAYDGIAFSVAITAARRHGARLTEEFLASPAPVDPTYEVIGATVPADSPDVAANPPVSG